MKRSIMVIAVMLFAAVLRAEVSVSNPVRTGQLLVKNLDSRMFKSQRSEAAAEEFKKAYEVFKARSVSGSPEQKIQAYAAYKKSLLKLAKETSSSAQQKPSLSDSLNVEIKMVSGHIAADTAALTKKSKSERVSLSSSSEDAPVKSARIIPLPTAPPNPVNDIVGVEASPGTTSAKTPQVSAAASKDSTTSDLKPKVSKSWRDRSANDIAKLKTETLNKTIARCFYGGFAGHDESGKCKPASDDPASLWKQSGAFAKDDLSNMQCGSGLLPCNPVVFGLGANDKAICVPRNKGVTAACEKMSKLKEPCTSSERELAASSKTPKKCEEIDQAIKAYKETMAKKSDPPESKSYSMAALTELRRSVIASCGSYATEDSRTESETARKVTEITVAAKNSKVANANRSESGQKDLIQTCLAMKQRLVVVESVLYGEKAAFQTVLTKDQAQETDAAVK